MKIQVTLTVSRNMFSLMGLTGRGFSDRRRSLFQIWKMMKTQVTLIVSRNKFSLMGWTGRGFSDRR